MWSTRKLLSKFPADCPVPEEVQEDPPYHRVGPPDGLWGCLLRPKHHASWNCYWYISYLPVMFPDADSSLQSSQMKDRGLTSLMVVSSRIVSVPLRLYILSPLTRPTRVVVRQSQHDREFSVPPSSADSDPLSRSCDELVFSNQTNVEIPPRPGRIERAFHTRVKLELAGNIERISHGLARC